MKKYLFALILFVGSLYFSIPHSKDVYASASNCNSTTHPSGSNEFNDRTRFPFGFLCPRTDNNDYTQVNLSNGSQTPFGTYNHNRDAGGAEYVAPGQTLNFTTGFTKAGDVRTAPIGESDSDPGNGPGNPPSANNPDYPDNDSVATNNDVYVWTIIDGNNSVIESVTNTGNQLNGSATRACPTGLHVYDGVSKYLQPNNQTTAGWSGYWGPSSNDPNRSYFADKTGESVISCANEGRMIVWKASDAQANTLVSANFFNFNVKLKDDFNFTGDKEVCLRTMVSVKYDSGSDDDLNKTDSNGNFIPGQGTFDVAKLSHVAAKSKYRCYRISSTRVEGTVRSDSVNATGKLLPAVTVYYDRNCDGYGNEGDKSTTTGPRADTPDLQLGEYRFGSFVGEKYCIYLRGSRGAPQSIANSFEGSEGTTYRDPLGLYRGTGHTDYGGITNQVAGVTCGPGNAQATNNGKDDQYYINCGGSSYDIPSGYETENVSNYPANAQARGHDFRFNPVAVAPEVDKVAWGRGTDENGVEITDPVLSQTLRPGDMVSFDIYIENTIDSNQDVQILDYIPLNIDPNSVVLECVQIDPLVHQYKPPQWGVYDGTSQCRSEDNGTIISGAYNSYYYGNDEISTFMSGRYIYTKNLGSGNQKPYMGFDAVDMPAYSGITFSWRGRVKSSDKIGVYPGYSFTPNFSSQTPYAGSDYRFCNAPNGGTYNSTGRLTECEDVSTSDGTPEVGYQSVINFTETRTSLSSASRFSPITFNPIPGEIKSITKEIESSESFDGIPAYDTDPSNPTRVTMRNTIVPNNNLGPTRFRVIDQSNNPPGYRGLSDFNGLPLDIAISNVGVPSPPAYLENPAGSSIGTLVWRDNSANDGNINSSGPIFTTYSFDPQFDEDRPVGDIATNTSKVCWAQYWILGHPIYCITSDQKEIRRIRTDKPTVGVDFGGVNGGGNFYISPNVKTCTPSGGSGGVSANPGSYGMYMLSAQNNTIYNSFTSKSGFNITSTKPGDGLKCRPDLAEKAATHTPTASLQSNPVSGTNPSSYKNNVVKHSGDVTINDLQVDGRWTMYVQGRVYIKGNITRKPGVPLTLADQHSLGIIATDGIYISNGVSQIDAMLYAGTKGIASPGVIDTCAINESAGLKSGPAASIGGSGYTAAQCRANKLTINGVMYAKTLRLNRTTVDIVNPADKVSLVGQTYLMMPPLFNDLMNSSRGNIRETRPRF